jgi:hypothetical protein
VFDYKAKERDSDFVPNKDTFPPAFHARIHLSKVEQVEREAKNFDCSSDIAVHTFEKRGHRPLSYI